MMIVLYGFTSMATAFPLHNCGERSFEAHNFYNPSQECHQIQTASVLDCCKITTLTCQQTYDQDNSDNLSIKTNIILPAVVPARYPTFPLNFFYTSHANTLSMDKPLGFSKIRLHLLNRILLI